jgi:methionyl-tRNA formyltransferase
LQALDEHQEVVGVVTQPDRPAGRGRRVVASAVKEEAVARNLPVFQPASLRSDAALDQLAAWHPEVAVVAAFGQILQGSVLELPVHGCLNVHASLLPRYRGAAPIAAALLDGERVTGVTIMRMDEGMDTGPILGQAECPITTEDTTGSLTTQLADLGARLLLELLPVWLEGRIQAQPQDEALASYCRPLTKQDGRLDWSRSAAYLDRQVRACDPWPGAYTMWQGKRLKVLQAHPRPDWVGREEPGTVIALEPAGLGVATGQGAIELVGVQLAGKKPMPADVFARGQRDLMGGTLGA